MLFILNRVLPGQAAAAAGAKTQDPAAGQLAGGGFAGLLALLQAAQQPQAGGEAPALPRAITVPGNAENRTASMQGLLAQLQELAGTTLSALQTLNASGGTPEAQDALLAQAAVRLGEMLQAFDSATGADSLQTLAANLAALQTGADPVPPPSEGDGGVELAQAMFGLAAGLLGLADKPVDTATKAPEPARPLAVAGGAPALPEPAQHAGVSAAPALAEKPAPEAGSSQATRPGPVEGETTGTGTESRASGRPAGAKPRAVELLTTAVQAKPASGETAPLPQGPLPQAVGDLRLHAGIDAPEPRSTAQPQPPAQSDGFARNLANQIRSTSFDEGRTRIELSPRGLGSIEIDLQADEAGKLRLVLRAENPAVLNALRGDRAALLSVLGDSGVAIEESALDFEAFGQQRQQQPGAAPLAAGSGMSAEDETDTADPAPRGPRHVAGTGRLDIIT